MQRESGAIVVAGAGIGGLTAAHALRQRGLEVQVLERATTLRPAGAGIVAQANAMVAFERLGLAKAVAEAGQVLRVARILRADGRVLAETSAERLAEAAGAPSVALHRARLQAVLLEAVGAEHVRTGAELAAVEDRGEAGGRVVVRLADGERVEGRALVGADGLRSAVRAALFGAAEPDYAGYTTWRGIARDPGLPPGEAAEMWGRGARFGYTGVGFGEVYWFAVLDAPAGGRDETGAVLAFLRERFSGFAAPVRALLDATAEEDVLRTDVHDREPLSAWGVGRVTLLGDAAHPMTPNLGQGGCQAIEDAFVLAEALAASGDDVEGALRRYESLRKARAESVAARSRSAGRIAQSRGAVASRLRDLVLRATPTRVMERQALALQRFPY